MTFKLVGNLTTKNPCNCHLLGAEERSVCVGSLAGVWLPAKILRNAFKGRRGGIKVCDDFQKLSRILRSLSPNSFNFMKKHFRAIRLRIAHIKGSNVHFLNFGNGIHKVLRGQGIYLNLMYP